MKLGEWKIVFFIAAAFYFSGNLLFVIIGKAEIQPWNEAVDEADVIKVPAEHVAANLGEFYHMERHHFCNNFPNTSLIVVNSLQVLMATASM